MAIKSNDSGVLSATEATNFLSSGFDGVMTAIAPDPNEKGITIKEARWGMVLVGAVSAIASGMFTRHRIEKQGAEPMLGFIF